MKFPDIVWVRDVILYTARYDGDVQRAIERMWEWEERVYERTGKSVDGWEEFYGKVAKRKLARAAKELAKWGVDIERIGWRRLRYMVEKLFLQWVDNYFDPKKVGDDVVVYGESMGFILEEGSREWEVFEGSDEPGKVDMELYRKLILGKRRGEKVVLWGMRWCEVLGCEVCVLYINKLHI